MAVKPTYYLLFVILTLVSFACTDKKEVFCTMEFRTITITVNRSTLDDYYTIRQRTGDTIRIERGNVPANNDYPVLDDRFQPVIQDNTEQFRFLGFNNNTLIVDELFVIKADKCHIDYVSGNLVVN